MQERKKAINMKASKYRQVGLMSAGRPLPWWKRRAKTESKSIKQNLGRKGRNTTAGR